jgi:hypothetical protein
LERQIRKAHPGGGDRWRLRRQERSHQPRRTRGLWADNSCDGAVDADLGDADVTFIGEDKEDWAGKSVSGAGDVDGDGLADILIGAVAVGSGEAYLIYGSSLSLPGDLDLELADHTFECESDRDDCGYSVATVGDVDGDTLSDILIGAPSREPDSYSIQADGIVYLVLGASLSSTGTHDLGDADFSFSNATATRRSAAPRSPSRSVPRPVQGVALRVDGTSRGPISAPPQARPGSASGGEPAATGGSTVLSKPTAEREHQE